MKYLVFNIIFLILLIHNNTLKTQGICEDFTSSTDTINSYKNIPTKDGIYYILIFTNRNDNFSIMKQLATSVNLLFSDILEMHFYCHNKAAPKTMTLESDDRFDESKTYIIRDGELIEEKTLKYLSSEYLDYILNKFNLHEHVEAKVDNSKYTYITFSQTC